MLGFVRKLHFRPGAEVRTAVPDPNVSRAGRAVAGMRSGDAARFRPSSQERDLAAHLGTTAYDSEDRRL